MKRLESDKTRLSAQLNQMLQTHKEMVVEKAKLVKSSQESTKHLTDMNVKYLEIVRTNSQLSEENEAMKKEISMLQNARNSVGISDSKDARIQQSNNESPSTLKIGDNSDKKKKETDSQPSIVDSGKMAQLMKTTDKQMQTS